jgi:hypothetical protein
MVPLSLLVRNKSALRLVPKIWKKLPMLLHGACPAPTFRKFSAFKTPETAPLQRPKITTNGGNFVKLFREFDSTARLFRARPSPAGREELLTLSGKRFDVGERSEPSPAAYALFNLPRFFSRAPLICGD